MSEEVNPIYIHGKKVALVPELHYQKNKECPHCKSTKAPISLSDCKEMDREMVDIYKCAEEACGQVFLVLIEPRFYLSKPIALFWSLTEKGVKRDEQAQEQGQQAGESAAAGSGEDKGESADVDGPTPVGTA